ncbi:hypothetical protein G2W53_039908 [Senna tora]|uniref:Putative plant transposon protein domain-containing protein n=1 Tax=Senna tora TaxID=362788 RepID=A0A834SQA2_9FABA|nr:hypothetical protein G2W53_039908 [Senna tora]
MWKLRNPNNQHYMHRTNLLEMLRTWPHFITANVLPPSNLSDVTPGPPILIYLLMTNQPVRLDWLIMLELHECKYNKLSNKKLIFLHLITSLYQRANASSLEIDGRLSQERTFNYSRVATGIFIYFMIFSQFSTFIQSSKFFK